jgi:hypothetical protein
MKAGEYELFTSVKLPAPVSGFITTPTKEVFESDLNIVVFPNPTDRYVNFKYNGPNLENTNLVLFDATGKQIACLLQNETIENGYVSQIDLKNYPIGIYFLNLFTKENQKTFLLSKNN